MKERSEEWGNPVGYKSKQWNKRVSVNEHFSSSDIPGAASSGSGFFSLQEITGALREFL